MASGSEALLPKKVQRTYKVEEKKKFEHKKKACNRNECWQQSKYARE